ncbi:hypothetical protein S40293_03821 [Stachybotrys chartarum IBT 40293]|nr:hypothetical protein S40293_03821 [Stachybotrys chartarum IBT 40293]
MAAKDMTPNPLSQVGPFQKLPTELILAILDTGILEDSDLAKLARLSVFKAAAEEVLYKRDADRLHHAKAILWAATYNLPATLEKGIIFGGGLGINSLFHPLYPQREAYDAFSLPRVLACLSRDDALISPLHVAAALGHMDMVLHLLLSGADVNIAAIGSYSEEDPIPPLWVALGAGQEEVVHTLLAHGANTLLENENWRPGSRTIYDALVLAINSRLESVVAMLLKWPGLDVNRQVNERTTRSTPLIVQGTLLHQACEGRTTANIMQQLISAGADIGKQELKISTWGNGTRTVNPLYKIASSVGFIRDDWHPNGRGREILIGETVACAEILIKAGANVNISGDHGATPLTAAAATHCLPMINLLIENGAKPYLPKAVPDDSGIRGSEYIGEPMAQLICAMDDHVNGSWDSMIPTSVRNVLQCMDALIKGGALVTHRYVVELIKTGYGLLWQNLLPQDHPVLRDPPRRDLWTAECYSSIAEYRLTMFEKDTQIAIGFFLQTFPPPSNFSLKSSPYGRRVREVRKSWINTFSKLMTSNAISHDGILDLLCQRIRWLKQVSSYDWLAELMKNPWYRHSKHSKLLKAICSAGFSPRYINTDGQTCLHIMLYHLNANHPPPVEDFEALLDFFCGKGVNFFVRDKRGKMAWKLKSATGERILWNVDIKGAFFDRLDKQRAAKQQKSKTDSRAKQRS